MVGAGDLNNAGAREVVEAAASKGTDSTLRGLLSHDKGLTVVGDEVERLTDLQELKLGHNELTRVPVGLGGLEVLRVLQLHGHRPIALLGGLCAAASPVGCGETAPSAENSSAATTGGIGGAGGSGGCRLRGSGQSRGGGFEY